MSGKIKSRLPHEKRKECHNKLCRKRHVQGVKKASSALKKTLTTNFGVNPELVAEDLRIAATEIGKITNIIDVEEILDDIFNNFCIGK